MNVPLTIGALASAILLVTGCTPPQVPVEIPFEVRYGDRTLSCGRNETPPALTDLRFFVHDVRLVDDSGEEAAVQLLADSRWQGDTVAMLDLEDGTAGCDNGTRQMNLAIRGHAREDSYSGLRFRLGVPESLNHRDPLRAAAPLTDTAMHWHWKSGYKFLRAGVANEIDGFWLHLGSARCEGTVHDITGCRSPNRPEIEVGDFVPGEHVVAVDLRALFSGVDLEDGVPTDCSSGPAEEECAGPFRALGIPDSGRAAAALPSVFRAQALR